MTTASKPISERVSEPRLELTRSEADAWRALIESRCGIHFSEARTHQMLAALRKRMQETGTASLSDYYIKVTSARHGAAEWPALLEAVTNHETSFFRHSPTFRTLRETLLPDLAKNARPGERADVTIWSAGCSTGEEAYSAAMVCHDAGYRYPALSCSILASDVSEIALETATAARYGSRAQTEVPAEYQHYLTKAKSAGVCGIAAPAREMVRFSRVNFTQRDTYPSLLFDFILCQNVLVYFRPDAQRQVVEGLASRLKPGGFLLPGPGEIAGLHCPALKCVGLGDMQVFLKQSAERA